MTCKTPPPPPPEVKSIGSILRFTDYQIQPTCATGSNILTLLRERFLSVPLSQHCILKTTPKHRKAAFERSQCLLIKRTLYLPLCVIYFYLSTPVIMTLLYQLSNFSLLASSQGQVHRTCMSPPLGSQEQSPSRAGQEP